MKFQSFLNRLIYSDSINRFLNFWYYCPVCKKNIREFERFSNYYLDKLASFRFQHSLFCFETFNFRQNTCPSCGIGDVNRIYPIFLEQYLEKSKNNSFSFLDIAPIASMQKLIKTYPKINSYRSADLYDELAEDKVDIQDMNIYEDNSFDIILCSHVLEHVENDKLAVAELLRVIKPGGICIVMAPIMLTLSKTLENASHANEDDRWKYYGQHDHVRLYSKSGFKSLLNDAGFSVFEYTKNMFGEINLKKYGIAENFVLYVATKPKK